MLALGLMSGTSADGVTAALVEINGRRIRLKRHQTLPYPPSVHRRILAAPFLRAPELSRLNMELGELFAQAAKKTLGSAKVSVIGSHGQTIWHGPRESPPNTLQLGEPSVIAERTGLPVVADFRPRDIAAGGEGAPLIPAFDEFLFAQGPLRALQNIGGIANVSLAGKGRIWKAFDTGPGNCLMDLAVRAATLGLRHMDKDAHWARRGRPSEELVNRLLKLPYFAEKPPKSLERTQFGLPFLKQHFGALTVERLPAILATLALFTARSIHEAYKKFLFPIGRPSEIVVSGGGALNPVLMRDLKVLFDPIPVVPLDDHGIPAMAKEAACFAWMGAQAWQGKPNHCPSATGAKAARILGKIVKP